jgi:putative SOS response-associated peptidase YedK
VQSLQHIDEPRGEAEALPQSERYVGNLAPISGVSFAGIWTTFHGNRGTKSKPIGGPHQVYGFLTTAPNANVEPIHPKAMPVILTTEEERDVWMHAAVGRSEGAATAAAG